jgi:hypothetical protein
MKHLINGCPIDLRGLSEQELGSLIASTRERLERCQEELDSVIGEHIRRSDNVHQLRFEYDGPAVA